ncbi:carnosine synthase 1 isoform X1 [Mustela lutreola]|uniref:carnosine synthase 1 isoform X1 n=2 Tax=Mustela lutreola TaxID=9666 RepID=UPI0027976C54|nr:carnosine synthase 1 isoform X1 [Mustela lutreola]XP_059005133.1 carnosine synthase 1 isoform X1 [Mustela lutreola]XP_059005142.1 carnosine synthase 1 isoform X1 [Mustela lutreola]XP_059005149.1 carnosine synthase 1 isoform X1 [Mustela lutreola]
MGPLLALPQTHHFCPSQLSLDPLGPDWDCPLGSKDLEEEEGPWGGGSGLPPPGCFPGSWRQDVGLDCKGSLEGAEARAWTVYGYSLLQSCLQQAGLPETQDRSQVPRTGCPGAEVTLCILGSPSTFLSVLLEGGVQSPGNMLLCLSPAWLTKVPAPGQPGEAVLLVSKAVSFHPGGLTFLDDFVPPRRATYFLAGLGLGPGRGREAAELARDLTCPTGASAELARLLEDRLLTRRLLAQQGGVAVPATLAFTYKPPALLRGGEASPGLRLVELSGKEDQETLVKEEVGAFLHSGALGDALQVAVKLSGWRWRGRQALRVHPRGELGAVADTVLALLEKLEEEESVLVEAVCPPARLPFPGSPPPGPELAVRICAVVCRTQGDRPLLSKVVCSVGREDRPLRHQSSLPQTLEVALARCGLGEPGQVAVVRQRVKAAAEAALAAVLALEAGLSAEQRGGRRARTDFLGVDFALTVRGRTLTPVALELNSGPCLEACGALEGLWAALRPRSAAEEAAAAPLVETMLRRSAHYLMEGKQLLLIGAGGVSKKFVWEAARHYGLKLHLVESDPNHFASQLVQTFIHFDVTEHRRDEENARLLAELVRARGLQLDGCFSYWDDCLVLTALLCQELGLPCSPPAAMRLAKQKSCTQLHLLRCHGPPWPAPSLHAVPCCPLESEADVEKAVHQVPLPGVMKLEFGAGAVGVRLVEDAPQCREHFSRIARDLQGEADHPGIGLGWGNAMLLMEFVEGTEHDVDLVLFGGRLLAAFVSDNGPTRLPGFTETAACMPTGLAPEQEAQLVQAAFRCCLGCGLLDGVFNVELKLTGAGPKLIEINPRMGGFYLRDWILELYGVDLLLAAAMVACGLRPALPTHPRARGHLVGVMCLVSQHPQVLSSTASRETLQALHDQGLLRLNLLEDILVPGEYEEPYCSVACAGESPAEARLRLLGLCQGLGIDGPHYPVAHFLSHFK